MNFKSVLIIISVLVYTLSFKAVAQTYGVGNTSVTADVGQMGNATASIPIYCPVGRLDIKPSVNLVFNSQSNSGILGKGWNITGMSVISRSGNNWHLDNGVQETVKLSGTDKLTLDGQRLLLVQGATNSFFTHNNVFRTEVDQFVKVTYKNVSGNEYFEADTKDGGKVFYGQSNNSQHKPDGSSNVLAWYISKSYDRNGNYMEYFYSNTGGQILLTEIKYTGFDATINGTKTSSLTQENPFNKITFTYETTTYEGNQYINGEKLVQNKRLQTIKTYADANLARTYSMEYTNNSLNSYLIKVTEKNSSGEMFKPIEINWLEDGVFERKSGTLTAVDNQFKATGDFNGDGQTDLLVIDGELNPYANKLLGTAHTFRIFNIANSSDNQSANATLIEGGYVPYENVSAVLIGDIDSDGDDDIVFQTIQVNYYEGDGPEFFLQSTDYRYKAMLSNTNKVTNIVSLVRNIINNVDVDYYPSRHVPAPNNHYVKTYAQMIMLAYVIPTLVEADGDGYLDLLERETIGTRDLDPITSYTILDPEKYSSTIHILLSTKNKQSVLANRYYNYSVALPALNNYIPMDFNGNGIIDFLHTFDYNGNSQTEILEYDNSLGTFKHIYGTGQNQFPTKYHKFLRTGDFNGDGKTDLLYYISDIWKIAYSTGANYVEYNATNLWFLHNYHPDWCGSFIFEIFDANGDGRDDIVERHFHNSSQSMVPTHSASELNIYYSKGFGFEKMNITGSGSSSQQNYTMLNYTSVRNVIGDFNGDGKRELLLFDNSNDDILLEQFHQNSFKLSSINGKQIFTFTYSLMSNNGVYTRTNNVYLGKSISIRPPLYVVQNMNTKVNGLLDKTVYYKYSDLLYNKHGRGLMGFVKTTISDELTNNSPNTNKATVVNEYKQNLEFLFKLDLYSTTQYLVPNGGSVGSGNEVSKTVYTNTNIKTTTLNNNINFFYTSYKTETNKLNGLRKTTCLEYDENGNLIHTQESFDKINNTTGVYEYTNTSDFKYEQYNSWLPASLTINRNCQIRNNGTTPYYVQKEMKYFTNGNLNETEYFKNNLSYYYKEIINYDKYGNIVFTALDSANNNTTNTFKNTSYTYTNGRFLQKIKNALNQETLCTFEPMYGSKLSETNAANLTTTYEYDDWGKLIKTTYPNGNIEDIVYAWASTNTLNIYYYVTKSNSLGNMSWDYYDALDNKIMAKKKGFKGKVATKNWNYNADNMLVNESNWFDATSSSTMAMSKRLTEYSYDKYKRIETKQYSGTLISTYIYDYGTTKTTVKDGKNRQKYTILNATGLLETANDNGGTISYKYGSHNKLIETTTNGTIISIDYNVQLNKISMNDPNTGTILYDYNAFGDLIGQKDAKNNMYYFKYDELGRLVQKWGGNDVYEYTFYSTVGVASLNQIQKEEFKTSGTSKHKKEYEYNSLGSLQTVVETLPIDVYTTSYDYDAYQRIDKITYPTAIEITYGYDGYNNLEAILQEGTAIWTKNSEDIDGKMTSETYGNDITTTYSFDSYRQLSSINSASNTLASVVAFNANYNFEIETGNLLSRQYDGITNEEFSYDNLDRLTRTDETINGINIVKEYNYGANGNILSIENGGQHTLKYESAKPHALTDHKFENTITSVPSPSIDPHDYTYTAFDKIQHIEQNGVAALEMEYGVDQQRTHMVVAEYGNVTIDNYYVTSANMEIINGQRYTYLYAEGKPFAVYKEGEQMFYLHHDYQGSLMAISQQDGYGLREKRSYDAWGRPRDPGTWNYNLGMAFGGAGSGITMRGYTMHEHLEMFSLINMNGRLYDPIVGRMLSADNYIQESENTQNYNRYSYCLNNPLKYTDPSGNMFDGGNSTLPNLDINYNYRDDPFFSRYMQYWDSYAKSVYSAANYNPLSQSGVYQFSSLNYIGSQLNAKSSFLPSITGFYNYLEDNGVVMNAQQRAEEATKELVVPEGDILLRTANITPRGGETEGVFAESIPLALTSAEADGPYVVGDIVGAGILAGAAVVDLTQRVYVTYSLTNPETNQIYFGRTSGYGNPWAIIENRFSQHHMRTIGFSNPVLDRFAVGFPQGYYAIRGREQMLIDAYGGIGSPMVGNSINAIWLFNPNRPLYLGASDLMFGPVIK
ncbi:MAG: SpvB/TcaC N-terminal domain-containing protein [Bacteroidota bacterium]